MYLKRPLLVRESESHDKKSKYGSAIPEPHCGSEDIDQALNVADQNVHGSQNTLKQP